MQTTVLNHQSLLNNEEIEPPLFRLTTGGCDLRPRGLSDRARVLSSPDDS